MKKYIPSGLKKKDGTDIMCLSYEYCLRYPEEFLHKTNLRVKEDGEKYQTHKKHDKLFKDLFSNKEEATKFINKYLKLNIPIKPSEIEIYNNEFITNLYETRESDIVYKMKNINYQDTVKKAIFII